jgi:hypothetical protein
MPLVLIIVRLSPLSSTQPAPIARGWQLLARIGLFG